MNYKRAIGIGFLLYVATFAVGIIVAVATGADLTGGAELSTMHWVISMVSAVLLAGLFSLWYFKKASVSMVNGLTLGVIYLLVGIVLDGIVALPYVTQNGADALLTYYSDPWFYVSVLLIVLTPAVVGKVKGGK